MAAIGPTIDLLTTLVELLDAGREMALVTVIKSTGSTPRKAGTKAVVHHEGTILGTIGGGLLESKAKAAALESLASGAPAILDFTFGGPNAAEDKPICGGNMKVLIDPTVRQNRESYLAAITSMRLREEGSLITTFLDGAPPKVQVRFSPEALSPGFQDNTFVERIIPAARLLIAGGGHVGQALSRAALLAGFEVLVIEDREELANPQRYPEGVATRCGDVRLELEKLHIDRETYIAIVNRGHLLDCAALCACINTPARYIGMMGSRRKVALVRKEMVDFGKITPEQWTRIHAPIGLDIGAETVEEIAASIVAELIAARRKEPA
jgi:xanthine dehydrogenase accessory factor